MSVRAADRRLHTRPLSFAGRTLTLTWDDEAATPFLDLLFTDLEREEAEPAGDLRLERMMGTSYRLADGDSIDTALEALCERFDGFYTLLVSNRDSFAVVRDAIACKPAVIAEHPDWVAMACEYRALVGLPGIEDATLWEPEPEVIYAWTR